MTLRHAVCTLVSIAMAGAVPAAPVQHDDRPTATVRLQLNWVPEPEFGGIYAAERDGIFAAHGLRVEILKGGPDVPAVQMAAAGRVEFAVAAADEVVALREKGADVVALFATFQTSPQGIMVRASREVKDIPALLANGGTLIAQPGLAYLKYLRKHFGLDRVRIVPYGSGALSQFLDPTRSDVAMQCFVTAEPLTAQREGVPVKVFLIADTGFNPYTTVIVTSAGFLRSHRDTCRRLVAALREGWRRYLAAPGPTNRAMARLNSAMDLATFDAAAETEKRLIETARTSELGAMTLTRWTTLARQLAELGVIESPVDPAACFVNL
ncbi:MAG: ABC transporter substrate-binding protein [Acidobacteriota bacterium]